MNLLDAVYLKSLQPAKLQAELLRGPGPFQDLRAQVEFRMTPRPAAEHGKRFEVALSMTCRVSAVIDGERTEVLLVEYAATAAYRTRPGFEIDVERFRAGHSDLGRQLYPLMQQRVEPVFAEFGLRELRLPVEVVAERQAGPAGPTH